MTSTEPMTYKPGIIRRFKRRYHQYKASKFVGQAGPVAYTRYLYHLSKAEKL